MIQAYKIFASIPATISTRALARALKSLNRIIDSHSKHAVLWCVLIEISGNTLTLRTTNLAVHTKIELGCEGAGEGKIAIPCKLLTDLIDRFECANVTLVIKSDEYNQVLEVIGDRSYYKLNGIDAKEFPVAPTVEGVEFQVDANELISAANKAAQVIKKRYYGALSGWHLRSDGRILIVEATDGYQLFQREIIGHGFQPCSIILDPSLAQFLNHIKMPKPFGCKVTIGEEGIELETSECTVSARRMQGQFPDTHGIIESVGTDLQLNGKKLLAAASRVASSSTQKEPEIDLLFDITSLVVCCGENSEVIKIDTGNVSRQIRLKFKYLKKCLTRMSQAIAVRLTQETIILFDRERGITQVIALEESTEKNMKPKRQPATNIEEMKGNPEILKRQDLIKRLQERGEGVNAAIKKFNEEVDRLFDAVADAVQEHNEVIVEINDLLGGDEEFEQLDIDWPQTPLIDPDYSEIRKELFKGIH